MNSAARWVPLRYYLRLQRAKGSDVALSFRRLEGILGDGLPRPARKYPEWWANDPANEQARSWLEEGWRVRAVDPAGETVVFEQQPPVSRP